MMKNKANLFSFATKELSQDAFLMWLFENYDSNEIQLADFSKYFLFSLLQIECSGEEKYDIKNLSTSAQWKHIDVIVDVIVNEDKYILAIEDKTTSVEHNQLDKYVIEINNATQYKNHAKRFVFYKTSSIDSEEKKRIRKENIESDIINKEQWQIFDLKSIFGLFEGYRSEKKVDKFDNPFLNGYYEYLRHLHEEIYHRSQNMLEWTLPAWKYFFDEIAFPKLREKYPLFLIQGFVNIHQYFWGKISWEIDFEMPNIHHDIGVTFDIRPMISSRSWNSFKANIELLTFERDMEKPKYLPLDDRRYDFDSIVNYMKGLHTFENAKATRHHGKFSYELDITNEATFLNTLYSICDSLLTLAEFSKNQRKTV